MVQLEQFTTPVNTPVDHVVSRMRALETHLPPRDGLAVFNRVYLAVTESFDRHLDAGAFPDTEAAIALDVRFAERYLRVAEDDHAPACWRPLLQFRRHPGVRPLQFALAGINAHIGHDLALAVVDACRTLNCEPADLEDEFERVGDLLVSLEERIREELMPGPDLLQIADPLTHLLGAWSMERARAATWSAARALWALRRLPDVTEEFTDRLDAAVGFASRMLLTPLPD